MRGKQAAKAANRRAGQAAETIAELREKLNAERAEWQAERAELRNEVQRLRGKTLTDIERAASDRVAEHARECYEEIARMEQEFHTRSVECLATISNRHPELPKKTFQDASKALAIDYAGAAIRDGLEKQDANRAGRRQATNKQLNKFRTYIEDLNKATRP